MDHYRQIDESARDRGQAQAQAQISPVASSFVEGATLKVEQIGETLRHIRDRLESMRERYFMPPPRDPKTTDGSTKPSRAGAAGEHLDRLEWLLAMADEVEAIAADLQNRL